MNTKPIESKKSEIVSLFKQFTEEYADASVGKEHFIKYTTGQKTAQDNLSRIKLKKQAGEDITDDVILGFLPHADSKKNRERGAWIHVAPAAHAFKGFLSRIKNESDWPGTSLAIFELVSKCSKAPESLGVACAEFAESPYAKGFQSGMLSPILNALRPEAYSIINGKVAQVFNFMTGNSLSTAIRDYPKANEAVHSLVKQVGALIGFEAWPEDRRVDVFDMFCHWYVAVRKDTTDGVSYWKISPGDQAWNWDACLAGGFISMGWDAFGDISTLDDAEFEARASELQEEYGSKRGWTKRGVRQLWRFAKEIKIGDKIVANRGTTEVLGIGTVTEGYYFVDGERHGHRIPVSWDDVEARVVQKGGWRRALIPLKKKTFDEVVGSERAPDSISDKRKEVTPNPQPGSFTSKTFQLLAELHNDPTRTFYMDRQEEMKEHVELPFQQLLIKVVDSLSPAIREAMETKKRLFSRILKNDYGRGGAWDFYWGAFYPIGGKRTADAQLFAWMDYEEFGYGFYIGKYGTEARELFARNCEKYGGKILGLLEEHFRVEGLEFYEFESDWESIQESKALKPVGFPKWIREAGGSPIRAGVRLPSKTVEKFILDDLARKIADCFNLLFPLVLLAVSEDPVDAIAKHVGANPDIGGKVNPAYPLTQCAEDTLFPLETLEDWARSIERKKQIILYGPPGTGKTYMAEKMAQHIIGEGDGFSDVLQFHPSYAYEDFMQGLRPKKVSDKGLEYKMVPGRFKEFCDDARLCSGRCVLIIDEINRANLSRVFGELMYLLEYRESSVPLSSGENFKIPENVRIIGTMNTADRSIALVDHALRRRFAFIGLYPDYDVLRRFHEKTAFNPEGLVAVLEKLNATIGDRHYSIGITYFLSTNIEDEIEDVWHTEIEPYVEELFFDQEGKAENFSWDEVGDEILGL